MQILYSPILFISFFALVFILSLGIHGKPTALYTMMLLADLQNTPETGKGNDAEYNTRVVVGDEKGNYKGDNARQ